MFKNEVVQFILAIINTVVGKDSLDSSVAISFHLVPLLWSTAPPMPKVVNAFDVEEEPIGRRKSVEKM